MTQDRQDDTTDRRLRPPVGLVVLLAGQRHLFAGPMPAARPLAALHGGTGGRPGAFAPAPHEAGRVRIPTRRAAGRKSEERLPELPA